MYKNEEYFERDLFEIENAINLTRNELVETFVPTQHFWRLLSAKNHVVLGSRGSGKTALAKMLSHSHLSKLKDPKAQKAISTKSFIGIYVATTTEWVGGLKNKQWPNDEEKQLFFQWRLNISTCLSFLDTLKSCLLTYIENDKEMVMMERKLIKLISNAWSDDCVTLTSISDLENHLKTLEYKKQIEITKNNIENGILSKESRTLGYTFNTDLFILLRRAIQLTSDILNLPENTIWLLCLDEAEFLEPQNLILINTYLRDHNENLYFKITTRPYYFNTLDTLDNLPLNIGDDFEFIYIDRDPVLNKSQKYSEGLGFAELLFNKRAEVSGEKYNGITLQNLFGRSELLDSTVWDLSDNSTDMKLLHEYCSKKTIDRANELNKNPKSFMDQIGRKIRGSLYLRHEVKEAKGHKQLEIYSGASLVVRCGDGNPRRLIRLFNSMLLQVDWNNVNKSKEPILSKSDQNKVLTAFSYNQLTNVQSEKKVGPLLYELLTKIGNFMKYHLHDMPLSTDQISSIKISSTISDKLWELIQHAVAIGLLYPNVKISNPNQLPFKSGTFHFAYVLSLYFQILPRKGSDRNLNTIIDFDKIKNPGQLSILDYLI